MAVLLDVVANPATIRRDIDPPPATTSIATFVSATVNRAVSREPRVIYKRVWAAVVA